jgi:hypothetical protein
MFRVEPIYKTHLTVRFLNASNFIVSKACQRYMEHTWEFQLPRLNAEKFGGHGCSSFDPPPLNIFQVLFFCTQRFQVLLTMLYKNITEGLN